MTQHFQGEEGKQTIITAYLNQNYYGNQSYGVKAAADAYFGKELADLTPAQAAILAGAPPVAVQLRPRPQRGRALRGRGRRGRRVPGATSARWSSRPDTKIVAAAQHHPRPARRRAGRRCRATRTRRPTSGRQAGAGHARARRPRRAGWRRTSCGPSATSWRLKLCGADEATCDAARARADCA